MYIYVHVFVSKLFACLLDWLTVNDVVIDLNMWSFITGEKLKLLEEREQEKEKTTAHVGKADKVMAEVEELKGKMRTIELEKTTLQTTVSS